MTSNKLKAEEEQEHLQQELLAKLDTSKFVAHKLTVEDAVKHFKTNLQTGLTSAEAAKRLAEHGPNELDAEEDKSLWERIVEQFEDVLVRILLASATISFVIAITGKSPATLRPLQNLPQLETRLYGQTERPNVLFSWRLSI